MSINNVVNLNMMLQMNLAKATNSMNVSALRLTTGLKLNSMADGASSYIVASNTQQAIRGWQGAQESTQKGINIVNTAKGSLASMKSILNQLSGIADTAMTNAPGTDKDALQEKARMLLEQLYNQKNTTRFDGVKIFGDENNLDTLAPGGGIITKTTEVIGTTTTVGTTTTNIVKEVINGLINPVEQKSIEELEAAGYTVITSAADFKTKIEADPSGKFALFGNLDFTGVDYTPIGGEIVDGTIPEGFTGELNGNGFAIKNLTINNPDSAAQGLFSVLGDNSVVKNIIIQDAQISGKSGVGTLAGVVMVNAAIDNVAIIGGTVNGTGTVGGMVGVLLSDGTVTVKNSYSTAEVSGNVVVGGLVGQNGNNAIIENSYATGKVLAKNSFGGGLVGENYGTISGSWASGNTTAMTFSGGLVGRNQGTITNTFATGKVTANKTYDGISLAGGLVGQSLGETSTISNSYATGAVTADGAKVGGLVGETAGTITNSYATGAVTAGKNSTGYSYAGGLVGYSSNTITNSYAVGSVTSTGGYTGGFIGEGTKSIDNSYATGKVTVTAFGASSIGGFGGKASATNSYATGDVEAIKTATGTGSSIFSRVGGFIGINPSGSNISNSYATGNVNAPDSREIGGFIGEHSGGVISNSYSKGNVVGGVATGGFAGWSHAGEIKNSWTSGNVSAVDITIGTTESGGFVGTLSQGTISESYAKGKSSNGGGFAVNIHSNATVQGSYYNKITNSTAVTTGSAAGILGLNNTEFDNINIKVINNDLYSPIIQKLDNEVFEDATRIKITTASQFMSLISDSGQTRGKTFILMADIDFSGITNYQASTFAGTLDGNGHTIKNLTTSTGLFTDITMYGIVSDVVLENFNITGTTDTGALAGHNNGGWVSNVTVKGGSVSGSSNTGGLIGRNTSGAPISMCQSSATVTGIIQKTGGLVGDNDGRLDACAATGNVTQQSGDFVGGLAGYSETGNVLNCYTSGGTVFADNATNVGGLIGGVYSSYVQNSYSSMTVKVTGSATFVGGLIGRTSTGVQNCHFDGNVEAALSTKVGGLVGELTSAGGIRNSKSNGNVSGQSQVGGLVGRAYGNVYLSSSSANVTGGYEVGGFAGRMEQSTVENSYATGNVNSTSLSGGFVGFMGTTSVTRQTYASGTITASDGNAGGYAGNISGSTVIDGYWNKESSGLLKGYYQQSYSSIKLAGFTNAQVTDPSTFGGFDFKSIWTSGIGSPTLKGQTGATIIVPPRYSIPVKEGSIGSDAGLSSPITYPSGSTVVVSTTQKTFTTLATTTTIGITTTEKVTTTTTEGTPITVKNEEQLNSIYTSHNSGIDAPTSLNTGMTFGKIYFDVSDDGKAASSKAVIESIIEKINTQEKRMNYYLDNLNSSVQTQKDNIKSLGEQFDLNAKADMEAEEANYLNNQIRIQNISAIMIQSAQMRYAPVMNLLKISY